MKNIIKLVLIITLSSVVYSGCANKVPSIYIEKESSLPSINQIATAEVGENLYEKRGYNTYIVKLEDNPSELKAKEYNYLWLLLGVPGAGIMYATSENSNINKSLVLKYWTELNYKMICNDNSDCLVDIGNDNIFTHSATYPNQKLSKIDKNIKYELTPVLSDEDSFKYIALYQGKIGDKIKISFREFYNNNARPAFTQDIEYELELNKNTIIGFKGLRIEVLSASNVDIKYKVVEDYK